MRVLITGAAGYIGSHTLVEALSAGHEVHALDSFVNASPEALARVRALTGRDFGVTEADVRDRAALDRILTGFRPETVIHFAALKAVDQSVAAPLPYYGANVSGTVTLLEALAATDCRRFVFSSSATVYGDPETTPVGETASRSATNPYGRTKLMIERILEDLAASDPSWTIALLRYFNPVGAHPSGRIGEDPAGVPGNLMPFIAQVAVGRRSELAVFGDDYDTPDGTALRDYLHVVDLARAHLAAMDWAAARTGACEAFNLGTGRGVSVLEVVRAFAAASGRPVPFRIAPRRPGDVARLFADPGRAERELGWRAERRLAEMCADSWRWQSRNPQGYGADAGTAGVVGRGDAAEVGRGVGRERRAAGASRDFQGGRS